MDNKLTVVARDFVFQKFKEGEQSNQVILEGLKNQFGIAVSSSYISQMRCKAKIQDLTIYNDDVEKKIRKKMKIDVNVLEVAEDMTEVFKKWFKNNKEKIPNYSAKEIALLMGASHKFFREYKEMTGGTKREESIHSKIVSLDILPKKKEVIKDA